MAHPGAIRALGAALLVVLCLVSTAEAQAPAPGECCCRRWRRTSAASAAAEPAASPVQFGMLRASWLNSGGGAHSHVLPGTTAVLWPADVNSVASGTAAATARSTLAGAPPGLPCSGSDRPFQQHFRPLLHRPVRNVLLWLPPHRRGCAPDTAGCCSWRKLFRTLACAQAAQAARPMERLGDASAALACAAPSACSWAARWRPHMRPGPGSDTAPFLCLQTGPLTCRASAPSCPTWSAAPCGTSARCVTAALSCWGQPPAAAPAGVPGIAGMLCGTKRSRLACTVAAAAAAAPAAARRGLSAAAAAASLLRRPPGRRPASHASCQRAPCVAVWRGAQRLAVLQPGLAGWGHLCG